MYIALDNIMLILNTILAVLSLLTTFDDTYKGKDITSLLRVHDVTIDQG